MRFKYESERHQHPQARHIPEYFWKTVFKGKLEPHEQALMMSPPDLSAAQRKRPVLSQWIAFAAAHRNSKTPLLQELALYLGMYPKKIALGLALGKDERPFREYVAANPALYNHPHMLRDLCGLGKLRHVKHLVQTRFTKASLYELLVNTKYKALLTAAEFGHIALFEFLLESIPEDVRPAVLATIALPAFRAAALNNKPGMLTHLAGSISPEILSDSMLPLFVDAVSKGLYRIARLIPELAGKAPEEMVSAVDSFKVLRLWNDGHLSMFQYLADFPSVVRGLAYERTHLSRQGMTDHILVRLETWRQEPHTLSEPDIALAAAMVEFLDVLHHQQYHAEKTEILKLPGVREAYVRLEQAPIISGVFGFFASVRIPTTMTEPGSSVAASSVPVVPGGIR